MEQADRKVILDAIGEFEQKRGTKLKSPKSRAKTSKANSGLEPPSPSISRQTGSPVKVPSPTAPEVDNSEAARKDNNFRVFRKICAEIAECSAYTEKSARLHEFLSKGTTGGIALVVYNLCLNILSLRTCHLLLL